MPKQRTVREVLKRLKAEGFFADRTAGSHQRWIHKDDPKRWASISAHHSGQTIPIGTLKSIEKTSGVEF